MMTLDWERVYYLSKVIVVINLCSQSRKKKKSSTMTLDWQRERETGIKTLLNLVQLKINQLWDPPVVEEEFVE